MSLRVVRTAELETPAGKITAEVIDGTVTLTRSILRDTRQRVTLDVEQLREITEAIDPRPAPLETLIDGQSVAAALGISISKLNALADAGEAPAFIAFGNRRRWRPDDVNAWIHAQLGKKNHD